MMASEYQVKDAEMQPLGMFETSAIGALTPSMIGDPEIGNIQQHVEFPQFQSILQTLIPTIEVTEIAHIYVKCYNDEINSLLQKPLQK